MPLELGGVVADVVDDVEAEGARDRPNTRSNTSRTRWVMSWRFANAVFAAAVIAPKYARPSGERNGAQPSSRSCTAMPWVFIERSKRRR